MTSEQRPRLRLDAFSLEAALQHQPRPKGWRSRRDGKGYGRKVYEDAIGKVLDRLALGAGSLPRTVPHLTEDRPPARQMSMPGIVLRRWARWLHPLMLGHVQSAVTPGPIGT